MSYQMKIRLEASAVPSLLGLWLAEDLPVDFRVLGGHVRGMRVLVVTITGSTRQDIEDKRAAFMATVRRAGFTGMTLDDIKPRKK